MTGRPSARTLFARACATGDLAAVEAGLAAGAALGPVNPKGLTPLHLAAFTSGSPEVVRRLVAAGAEVDAPVTGSVTRFSAYADRERVGGRELNPPDTPLLAAVGAVGNPLWREGTAVTEIVGVLLDAGADPNAPGAFGMTPLLRFVYERGPKAPEIMRSLLAAGADRDAVGGVETPLYAAISMRDDSALLVLLDAGADPCRLEDGLSEYAVGNTPLHWSACAALRESTFARILDAARDVDVRDARGRTPLHRAAAFNGTGHVRMLLDAGADPAARVLGDQGGETPLAIARRAGLPRVAEVIAERLG
ncbi:ankyrin repeat domain-containing protein [Phytomonospora sp. NPDC050363]|uniref:ankyrin repeat domain-containing protein n=1 Tax=Phytomonospora sp. NPDC050363 TaxID=3155642 RepID=UPI0033E06500